MAIYHFEVTIICRSKGQSAVASASYRASQKLYDKRLGITHGGQGKQGLVHSKILVPPNAPSWAADREKLWNEIEEAEKRKNSQVARVIRIGLPIELTLDQQISLIREFSLKNFVDIGIATDINIYAKNGNPHGYIMLPTRIFTPTGFCKTKFRELHRKSTLIQWRKSWADYINYYLASAGHDIRVDHRSYADRDIDLEPQNKIGVAVNKVNRSSYQRFSDHQRIARENGDRIIADPKIALDLLSKHQVTFSEDDLRKLARRQSTSDQQFKKVFNALMNHIKTGTEHPKH